MTISQKAIDAIKGNLVLKNNLAASLVCATTTIDRWIRKKDIQSLTGAAAIHIDIIKKESGLNESEILVSEGALVQS